MSTTDQLGAPDESGRHVRMSGKPLPRSDPASPPEQIEDVRVALVGYRTYDGGPREERVDLIDARIPSETLVSLTPEEAVYLANHLRQVSGQAAAARRRVR